MKYWTIVAAAVIVAAFFVAGCQGTKTQTPPAYVGTWINPGNDGNGSAGPPGKVVMTEQTATMYEKSTDDPTVATPTATGSLKQTDAWDSGGDHYFKFELTTSSQPGKTFYALACVSNNNNTLEMDGSNTGYPTSLSGDANVIFTRQ
jgi:hypothetical protein